MNQRPEIPIWQVDAFADKPFSGNPAAICFLSQFPDEFWMQSVASEMNLSETAYVVPSGNPNEFHLRWFTPMVEVDLCGHATLASAHTLIQQQRVDPSLPIRFLTRSGCLTCDSNGDVITMDFPATPPSQPLDPSTLSLLQASLDVTPVFTGKSREDVLIVVNGEDTVRALQPDFGRIAQIETRGIILTAASDDRDIDFVSRFFAPRFGVNEDPVTGSAHCCLAPYWSAHFGREKLTGFQASRRGGVVYTEVNGDRVKLSGKAVTVMKASLLV